jgi:hypothetical protein
LGIISVDFDITDQLQIRFLHSSDAGEKVGVHQLFIDLKKACDSVRRAVLYNIVIEFGVPMKLVRVTKMCLTLQRGHLNTAVVGVLR